MLVDLPAGWSTSPDHPRAALYTEHGHPDPIRLDVGMYENLTSWDVEHLLATEYPFSPYNAGDTVEERLAAARDQFLNDTPHDYGVCDEPAQVLTRWPQLATDQRPFLITFRQIRREDQPARDGWRWHKWGTYIGARDPQHEYLADEPHIDAVYIFAIWQLTEPAAAAQARP